MQHYVNLTSTIQDIISKLDRGLRIPEYQRSNKAWDQIPERRTQLIQSVLIGIPIPPIWIKGVITNGNVIDGLQRLKTLNMFKNNEFALKKAGLLTHLQAGYSKRFYRDLTPEDQSKFDNYGLAYYALSTECPIHEKDMFEILNRQMTANPAEVANGKRGDRSRASLNKFEAVLGSYVPKTRWEKSANRLETHNLTLSALVGLKASVQEYKDSPNGYADSPDGPEFGAWGHPMRVGGNQPTEFLRMRVSDTLETLTEEATSELEAQLNYACMCLSKVFGDGLLDKTGTKTPRFNLPVTILRFAAVSLANKSPDWWAGHKKSIEVLFKNAEVSLTPGRTNMESAMESLTSGLKDLCATTELTLN